MPTRSAKNEYRGVNAHLHSHFQNKSGWEGFHTAHITHLGEELSAKLPTGYIVGIEQSLQIREFHLDSGERIRRPKPDLTLYQIETGAGMRQSSMGEAFAPTLTQPIIDTLSQIEFLHYSAVLIYQLVEGDIDMGHPITRIELLSPTNKYGDGYLVYSEKRVEALKSGLKLVEIDYLHETESPVKGLQSYPRKQKESFAYNVTTSDPTPDMQTGLAKTYAFGVEVEIPTIEIPLEGQDSVTIDFNSLYHRTFHSLNFYSYLVDYEQLPVKFESYHLADQERIKAVMQRVKEENSSTPTS